MTWKLAAALVFALAAQPEQRAPQPPPPAPRRAEPAALPPPAPDLAPRHGPAPTKPSEVAPPKQPAKWEW